MIIFLLIMNIIFSIVNFAFLFTLLRIVSIFIKMYQDMDSSPKQVRAIEEPGLIDINFDQINYSGLPKSALD